MGHYPIKCIRCSHIMTNDTVLFDTKDAGLNMKAMLNENKAPASHEEKPEAAAHRSSMGTSTSLRASRAASL